MRHKLFLLPLIGFMIIPAFAAIKETPAPTPATNDFFFHDGDIPTVFLGDSITEQRMFTTLIESYVLSRFPNRKITFRNVGWFGDTMWLKHRGLDFDASLQRDVFAWQPKAVMIDFGMNDAREGDANYPKYLEYAAKLVDALKKAGIRVALVTSSPKELYEADAPAGSAYNLMLKKYSDGLKEVADKENVPFVDQLTPVIHFIEAGRESGLLSKTAPLPAEKEKRLTNDGVHPNWAGHLIMATSVLQGLHAPALVSSASLDASARSTTASEGCTIEWQDAPNGGVQFKRTDEALPWPTPSFVDLALKIPGFDPATALNRYELKVAGLAEGTYKLKIDDVEVGDYSKADLDKGINLGFVRKGSIYDQGQKLFKVVSEKNNAFFDRWRNVQLYQVPGWLKTATPEEKKTASEAHSDIKLPDWLKKNLDDIEAARTAEMARLDKVIAGQEQTIELLRKPVPHVFKLEPIGK